MEIENAIPRFLGASPPWVSKQIIGYSELTDLAARLRRRGDVCANLLRAKKMHTRQGVFDEFGAVLQFPYYFGENWNAFNDCIRDLEWLPQRPLLLWILDASELLMAGDSDEFQLLLRLLNETGDEFSRDSQFRSARAFHVVMHSLPTQTAELDARLKQLDFVIPTVELYNGKLGSDHSFR